MNVFELMAVLTLNKSKYDDGLKSAEKETQGFADKLKTGLGNATKIAAVGAATAVAAGTAAVAKLTKSAVSAYANYEQLVGGVETLFGAQGMSLEEYAKSVGKSTKEVESKYKSMLSAQETVMKNASEAYKTAGLSANDYMQTVTSFAASLTSSLKGDTEKAASYANIAITDMADNANKMGTSMESIQNAYQGFAKQNYTMLDNLKLGYGGTKTEMERLLKDAEKIKKAHGEMASYSIESYADVVEAIHVVQTEMGITGTTAKEAAKTISGSIAMTKSAWQNLVTGIADENADIEKLVNDFVDSAATAAENIIPRIEVALNGVGRLVSKMIPIIVNKVPPMIMNLAPQLLKAGVNLVIEVGKGLIQGIPQLVKTIPEVVGSIFEALQESIPMFQGSGTDIITNILNGITEGTTMIAEELPKVLDGITTFIGENLPKMAEEGGKILGSIAEGFINNLPTLIDNVLSMITSVAGFILDNLPTIVEAGISLIGALGEGILNAIPNLIAKLPEVLGSVLNFIASNLPKLLEAGVKMIVSLASGIVQAIPRLIQAIPQIAGAILNGLASLPGQLLEVGKNLIKGLWNGIASVGDWIKSKISGFFGGIVGGIKNFFGIKSPSRLMRDQIGKYMAQGVGVGFVDEMDDVKKDITNSMDISAPDIGLGSISYGVTGIPSTAPIASATTQGTEVKGLLQTMIDKLDNLGSPAQIILDTGVLVGETVTEMNKQLGVMANMNERSVLA